jgi:hypothetical protein
MRTKTLAITAALAAAGALTSMAQTPVYSVNAVGYINTTVCPGFSIIANQLIQPTGENTVKKLFPNVPEGTTIFKWKNAEATYDVNTYELGEWTTETMTLSPGEGAFIQNTTANPFTVTFVGEVPQGTLATTIPLGFSLVSSQVPQEGAVDTVLGYVPNEGDTVFKFLCDGQTYNVKTFELGEWTDSAAPVIKVGEGFFLDAKKQGTWTRNFSVNQ